MRTAKIFVHDRQAATLVELGKNQSWRLDYGGGYDGPPVSLTMPIGVKSYYFDQFPPFFEGVLPEGAMLEGLLQGQKIDRDDLFAQLIAVGGDLVGAVTVQPMPADE